MGQMTLARFNALRKAMCGPNDPSPAPTVMIDGSPRFCVNVHKNHRVTGASSDAMVRYAFSGFDADRPRIPGHESGRGCWRGGECGRDYPHDADDLGACFESLRLATAFDRSLFDEWAFPPGALDRMREVYGEFWTWVVAGVNRHGDHIVSTKWHPLKQKAGA